MGRPRKNRVGEYAKLLGEEIGLQLSREVSKTIAARQRYFEEEVSTLRGEIRILRKRLDALARRASAPRAAIGRWVPGGPGRPPKDAADRIAAFEARGAAKPAAPPRAGLQGPAGRDRKVGSEKTKEARSADREAPASAARGRGAPRSGS